MLELCPRWSPPCAGQGAVHRYAARGASVRLCIPTARVLPPQRKRLVMLYKMFEALGIQSSHRDPAPPLVNTRHQPKPTKASTVRNLQRPDRSPTRAPIDADIVDRDPATVVGLPAPKPGNATDLGRAAHRSLTKRSVLPEAIADTIGGRLFPQTALTTTASGPQAFVVLAASGQRPAASGQRPAADAAAAAAGHFF